MKSVITVLVLLLTSTSALASIELTQEQKKVKTIAKRIGQQNKVKGKSLDKTLQAIAWQESRFGQDLIGDCKHVKYYALNNNKKIAVNLEKIYFKQGIPYTTLNKIEKRVHVVGGIKQLKSGSLGPFQVRVNTAKYVIQEMKLSQYAHLLKSDTAIIDRLLKDPEFGATMAAGYLKINYKEAEQAGVKDPWWRSVSRYNGGNHNTTYVRHITNKMAKL